MAAAGIAAVAGFVSIEEYLNTDYEPDVDYVDGCIEERNLGETGHSKVQGELYFLLRLLTVNRQLLALTEARVQVSATRFRVPDVCVVREEDADNPIIAKPPLLCLEVLSPSQSLSTLRKRAKDFFNMGVPEVWVFDPLARTAYVCLPDSMTEHQGGMLRLAGTPVELSIEEVFKALKRKL